MKDVGSEFDFRCFSFLGEQIATKIKNLCPKCKKEWGEMIQL